VHGSVRPSNVMVASGVIKLSDLGLGRLAQSVDAPPSYRVPGGGLGAAEDLYALSAVMYTSSPGRTPLSQPPGVGLPLPSQLAPGVPGSVMDKLLLRGLHPRPELRPASADDLVRDLREMVSSDELPVCRKRRGKRACPAKGEAICSQCCGGQAPGRDRLPADCAYLDGAHAGAWEGRSADRNRDARRVGPFLEGLSEAQGRLVLLSLVGVTAIRARAARAR